MTKSVGTSYPFSSNNARSYQVPHVSNTSGNEYISPSNLPGSTIKLSTSLSPSSSSISFTHSDRFISCPSSPSGFHLIQHHQYRPHLVDYQPPSVTAIHRFYFVLLSPPLWPLD